MDEEASTEEVKGFKKYWNRLLKWLLNPLSVLAGMGLGAWLGHSYKEVAGLLAPYGDSYLKLLQMCVFPVMITAVASSLGSLIASKTTRSYLARMVLVLLIFLTAASVIGLIGGVVGRPGASSKAAQKRMGELILATETNIQAVSSGKNNKELEMNFFGENKEAQDKPLLMDFLGRIIPKNVFSSLSMNRNLQVLFFAIVAGIAIGTLPAGPAKNLLNVLEAVYLAFSKIIRWAMYLLPFGMFCLMAVQVSEIGKDILTAMAGFILVFYICGLIFFILCTLLIWYRSRRSLWQVLTEVKEPVIIALGTRNSLATIPSAITAMNERLGFDKVVTKLVLPLGVTVGRFGNIVYFALATVFIAQLYEVPLTLPSIIILVICSIIAGMATSGTTGVLTLAMLMIVLGPLKLPFGAAWVLFIAIDPIVDPIRTLTIVYPSCAITALVAGRDSEEEAPDTTADSTPSGKVSPSPTVA